MQLLYRWELLSKTYWIACWVLETVHLNFRNAWTEQMLFVHYN
jgi:hypothetical protein